MSTAQHEPPQYRRAYMLGKAKPTAIVGRNRETGEIGVIVLCCGLSLLSGLFVPTTVLKVVGILAGPALALVVVFMPYQGRTIYKWFEITRSYKRLLKTPAATWRSTAMEAGTRIGGHEVEIGPPPGVGRLRWLKAQFGPDEIAVLMHLDRRTITPVLEIEGPGVGSRHSEDQESLVDP